MGRGGICRGRGGFADGLSGGRKAAVAGRRSLHGKLVCIENTAILLIDCPDRKGIVAAIANFLYDHGANILHADQHQDNDLGLFFMRVEWSLADFDLSAGALPAVIQ